MLILWDQIKIFWHHIINKGLENKPLCFFSFLTLNGLIRTMEGNGDTPQRMAEAYTCIVQALSDLQ